MRETKWLLLYGIRRTVERFRTDWRDLCPAAWRTWLVTLTVGWIVSGLLAFLMAYGAQRWVDGGQFPWDEPLLRRIAGSSPIAFSAAMYLGVVGDSLFLFTLVPAAALVAAWLRYPLHALSILASLFLTDVVVLVAWLTWNRARPDIIYGGIAAPPLHSFPSGHSVQAIVVYGLLFYFWASATRSWGERLLAGFLFLLILGDVILTRLLLGTHWPSDILAAVPIGVLWLFTLIVALRRARSAGGGCGQGASV